MVRPSLLRSTFFVLRKYSAISNNSPFTRLFVAKSNTLSHIAKYCSESYVTKAFPQLNSEPKTQLASIEDEDDDITEQVLDENLSNSQQEYMLPSQKRKEYEDLLLRKIVGSRNAENLLDLYTQHSSVMSIYHLLKTMRMLNDFVVNREIQCWQLHDNSNFEDLCQRVLKVSRRMEAEDLISLLQYLCRMEVDANSKLVQTVLQLLRHSVNDLGIQQVIHLDFLLRKLPETPLSQGISCAIPLLVENLLQKEPLGSLSMRQLSLVLTIGIKGKVRGTGLILQELYKHGSIQAPKVALSILWSLMEGYTEKRKRLPLSKDDALTREVLMKECLECMARNLSVFRDVQIETTLHKITKSYESRDATCYNENFLNSVVEQCIKRDFGLVRCSHIVRKLLKLNYICDDLNEYLVSCILQDPEETLEAPIAVPSLITAITTTSLWSDKYLEALKILIDHRSMRLDIDGWLRMPTSTVALDLLSVGYHHQSLLEIITSDEFLSQYTKKHWFVITKKQLLQLNQAFLLLEKSSLRIPEEYLVDVKGPKINLSHSEIELGTRLQQIYEDPKLVLPNIVTEHDVHIDYLIIMDKENKPVNVLDNTSLAVNVSDNATSGETRKICDLDIPEDSKRVAVLEVRLSDIYGPKNTLKRYTRIQQQLLEASGLITVPIFVSTVNRLTFDEKNLYIKSLIDRAVKR